MALQSSGAISLNDVNVELGNSGTASINMGSAAVRDLFGVSSGAITMSNGYGASSGPGDTITFNVANTFNNTFTYHVAVAFDPNNANKFVVAYKNGTSTYGAARVGTVSGTSISFGSEYVFNSGNTTYNKISFDPNTSGKFVILYTDVSNSSYGKCISGTVSGTSISFGSEYVFNTANASGTSYNLAFDPNTAGKFAISFADYGNSYKGTMIIGTVSGTTISYGSKYVFSTQYAWYQGIAFDPNTANKFVLVYTDSINSNKGTGVVGTVSGTSISYGSEYVFDTSGEGEYPSVAFDPNTAGKFVVSYKARGNSDYGTSIVGTVSGTSISYGSGYVFKSAGIYSTTTQFDPNSANKIITTYRDTGNSSYPTASAGTISGNSIVFGTSVVIDANATYYYSLSFDPNTTNNFVAVYEDTNDSSKGKARVGTLT